MDAGFSREHSFYGIQDGASPFCPKCDVPMVERVARKGQNAGKSFFGCPNYPKCREVVQGKCQAWLIGLRLVIGFLPLQLVHYRPNLVQSMFVSLTFLPLVISHFRFEIIVIEFFVQPNKHLRPDRLLDENAKSVIAPWEFPDFAIGMQSASGIVFSTIQYAISISTAPCCDEDRRVGYAGHCLGVRNAHVVPYLSNTSS